MTRQNSQQQTLSVRIDDTLRQRLELAKELWTSRTGDRVSTSEIARKLLESARVDHLEVSDLLADPTDALFNIRRKGDEQRVLSRAEWTVLAYFVQHGLEASPATTSNTVSRESLVAVLDAFLAMYELSTVRDSRLNATYVGNLPADSRPRIRRADHVSADVVRETVMETRCRVNDATSTAMAPLLAGRNLVVLLDEATLGGEDISAALRPFWPALWRLAARGHYIKMRKPIRARTAVRDGQYEPPIPSIAEGVVSLSFQRSEGHEFSILLARSGDWAVSPFRCPIYGYPTIAEFRAMLAALQTGGARASWSGAFFWGYACEHRTLEHVREVGFRAHEVGITLRFASDEWATIDGLFRRAWELPDIRMAWDALTSEYGEL